MSSEVKPRKIAVIGSGFSGLTLARALIKNGFEVHIYEAQPHVGGMLQTNRVPVLSESAANALMADASVEDLMDDINVKLFSSGYRSNNRWILRDGVKRRLPLKLSEIIQVLISFLTSYCKKKIEVLNGESVRDWCMRVFKNTAFHDYLVAPALQGIYGTQPANLSAELVIKPLLNKKNRTRRGRLKGSVAPSGGMQNMMEALSRWVIRRGGMIYFDRPVHDLSKLHPQYDAVVLANHIKSTAEILKNQGYSISNLMEAVPVQPLTSVGLGFNVERPLKGFGCLFPQSENLNALGVLFNSDIFQNRGPLENETWIYNRLLSDVEALELVTAERSKLFQAEQKPTFIKVNRWPLGLPIYGRELLNLLNALKDPSQLSAIEVFQTGARVQESAHPLYLTGNYLGGIGLAKILSYNARLAERIRREIR